MELATIDLELKVGDRTVAQARCRNRMDGPGDLERPVEQSLQISDARHSVCTPVDCVDELRRPVLEALRFVRVARRLAEVLGPKWSKCKPPEPGMLDWIDLDTLVSLARLRLRNKKIIQDIEAFKNVLLNAFLDHILETEYPYLEKTLYERAKTQQLEQETLESIQHFKNQIYEIFLKGGITYVHAQILQTTEIYQPRQFVSEPYPEKTEHTLLNETLDLNTIPELLPSHESMMRVDGKSYLTVIHYAYDILRLLYH